MLYIENPTDYIKRCYTHAIIREWPRLLDTGRYLASEKAYTEFLALTGKDIRDCTWASTVKTLSGEKVVVHNAFVFEHLTTVYDFTNDLIALYNGGKLTLDTVAELLGRQRICWITKEENLVLNRHGYFKHRENPYEAYTICGIALKN